MTYRHAAPGPQLATGRLRVDAARAIAKLREYQLADRTAWILEAIRAAVASGATRIELAGDSNDVWLRWDGPPWPADELPRLFDELVSPAPANERHHLRLLAAGVNSALGMNPAYVDVVAIGEGGAVRARYTPEVLVEGDDAYGDAPLRRIAVEPIPAPSPARSPGMEIHLRRRASLEVMTYLVSGPPELDVAAAACRDIAVPLTVAGRQLHRDIASRDVVRVPLDRDLDGFLAITDAGASPDGAVLEVAERGVVLVCYALDHGLPKPRAPQPIRLFCDAPRMPTNAARSQVRHDSYPIDAAVRRARELVPALVARLSAEVATERGRAAALALLAAHVAIVGHDWPAEVRRLDGPLHALAALPLLRDAVGEPRPLAWSWNGLVHRGDRPFGAELAPWLGGVAWIPSGDAAERLLAAPVDPSGVRRQLRWARQQSRAHRRFFAHRPAPPKLAPREPSLIHVPLGVAVPGSCVSDAVFAGMAGEVWIPVDQRAGRGGELILLLDGRELERATFESPIAFTVIVDTKDVTPAERYRGAIRDGRYVRIERAMRAGLVRAVERHVGGADASPELRRLAQATLAVVDELHIRAGGPLAAAAIWQTTGGARVALDELVRRGVVGIVPPGTRAHAPAGRLVVEADGHGRLVLGRHVGRLVPYERAGIPNARDLASHLLRARHHALAIDAGDTVGAVAVSDAPRLIVYHMGVELASRAFEPQLVGCTIAIDSPAVIPDADWRGVIGDGIDSSLLVAWELAFVRAAARAIAGERPTELIGRAGDDPRDDRDIRGELGRALCAAVLAAEPEQLLGAPLLVQLRDGARVAMYGETFPRSIAELAGLPDNRLPHVDADGDALPGFVAVVADAKTASAVARLAGKTAHNATAELGERRRAAAFAARLERHRQLPEVAVALPGGVGVAVTGATARGVVGLSSGELWIEVLVERRRFARLHPGDARDLPLVAVVDVATGCCDTTFEQLVDLARDAIVRDVESAVGTLLAALVAETPDRFAVAGPHRTLLARALATVRTRRYIVDAPAIVRALCTAALFPTVQGGRVALEELGQPLGIVQCAAWNDAWLDAGDGPASALDLPILRAGDELDDIIRHLHAGPVADVSDDVRKLQAQRQIARGLVPAPRLIGVAPELARRLSAFGERGARLGHGEIGLCAGAAELLVHDRGVLHDRLPLDVMPPVQLAIDAPELARGKPDPFDVSERFAALGLLAGEPHPLSSEAQVLATELVAAVVRDATALPAPIRREVARAYLAGRLPAQALAGIPLFDTIDGRVLTIAAIAEQLVRFGDVWAVPARTAERPLDDTRAVVIIGPGDFLLGHEHGHRFVDGARELALDATARRNRARPPVDRLVLPAGDGVLATAELDDGPRRGVIAVLAPDAASRRGLIAHRDGHPFDAVDDPGPWPTLAVVEDPRLEPDRTWARPRSTPVWSELCSAVRVATGHALATLVVPPADALAVERIHPRTPEVASVRDALVYGAVWLIGAPFVTATAIDVAATGAPLSTPRWDGVGARFVAVVGDRGGLDQLIGQIVDAAHARLLRALVSRADVDPDAYAAHVANGLATRSLLAIDARGIAFDCFAPAPLDAGALQTLFAGNQPVATAILADDAEPGVTTFIDDDTSLARVVRNHLGRRLGRVGPRTPPTLPPRDAPPPSPAVPEVAHPLAGLLRLLDDRLDNLGIRGFHWAIVMRERPPVRLAPERVTGVIELAGDNATLLAVASACAAGSPWAAAAIAAVVAHVVTVLNVALTEITDATEAHALGVLLADLAPAPSRS